MTLHQSLNETLREEAVAETQKESAILGRKLNPYEFLREVGRKFIQMQIDNFPVLCDITRYQNKLKMEELQRTGVKGKYTDSLGWSESHNFKFEYEIPSELHLFMINLVYKNFWSNENKQIWRAFMKKIMQGEDSMQILMWAKSIYGSNQQKSMVV